jgi:hypothetical protein
MASARNRQQTCWLSAIAVSGQAGIFTGRPELFLVDL